MTDEKVTADEIIAAMRVADAKKKSGKGGSSSAEPHAQAGDGSPVPPKGPAMFCGRTHPHTAHMPQVGDYWCPGYTPAGDVTDETGGRVSREVQRAGPRCIHSYPTEVVSYCVECGGIRDPRHVRTADTHDELRSALVNATFYLETARFTSPSHYAAWQRGRRALGDPLPDDREDWERNGPIRLHEPADTHSVDEAREDELFAAKSSIASFMREVDRLATQLADADADLDRALRLLKSLHHNVEQGVFGKRHSCSEFCEIEEFLLDHEPRPVGSAPRGTDAMGVVDEGQEA